METFFILIVGAVLFISIVLFYSIAQQQKKLQQIQPKAKPTKPTKSAKPAQKQQKEETPETKEEIPEETKPQKELHQKEPHQKELHQKEPHHKEPHQKESHQKEPHPKQPKSPKKEKVPIVDESDNQLLVLAKKNQKAKQPVEEIKEEDKKISVQEEEWRDAKKGQKAEIDAIKKKLADKEHELSHALKQIDELKKNITECKTLLAKNEKKKAENEARYKSEIQKLSTQHVKEYIPESHQITNNVVGNRSNPWGVSLLNNIETTRKETRQTREDLDITLANYEKRRFEYLQKFNKVDYFTDNIATQ